MSSVSRPCLSQAPESRNADLPWKNLPLQRRSARHCRPVRRRQTRVWLRIFDCVGSVNVSSRDLQTTECPASPGFRQLSRSASCRALASSMDLHHRVARVTSPNPAKAIAISAGPVHVGAKCDNAHGLIQHRFASANPSGSDASAIANQMRHLEASLWAFASRLRAFSKSCVFRAWSARASMTRSRSGPASILSRRVSASPPCRP